MWSRVVSLAAIPLLAVTIGCERRGGSVAESDEPVTKSTGKSSNYVPLATREQIQAFEDVAGPLGFACDYIRSEPWLWEHIKKYPVVRQFRLINRPDAEAAVAKLPDPNFGLGLEFENTRFPDSALPKLQRFTYLRHLSFRGKTGLTNDGLATIGKLTDLSALTLQTGDITDAGLVHLKGLTALHTLNLDGNRQVTNAGLAHLEGLSGLNYLHLDNTGITPAGLVHLKRMKQLRLVRTREVYTEEGFAYLGRYGIAHAHPEAIPPRSQDRPGNPSEVIRMSLGFSHNADEALNYIQSFKNLEQLDLPGSLTAKGLKKVHGFKKLTQLRIPGPLLDDAEAMKELKAALPKCKVSS
jgi:hypothetical protein